MRLDELLEDRGRLVNRHAVPVLMDTGAAARCVRAEDAAGKAREKHAGALALEDGRMSQPRTAAAKVAVDDAERELADAYAAAEDHMVEFAFESISSDLWDELILAHPPTDAQREKNETAEYDPTVFPLVAVAFSLSDPSIPADELDAYRHALARGDTPPVPPSARKLKQAVPSIVWDQLFAGALRVNRGANRVPLSLSGSATTRSSGVVSEPR